MGFFFIYIFLLYFCKSMDLKLCFLVLAVIYFSATEGCQQTTVNHVNVHNHYYNKDGTQTEYYKKLQKYIFEDMSNEIGETNSRLLLRDMAKKFASDELVSSE